MLKPFSSPEDAARAMGALVSYGEHLKKNGYADEYLCEFLKRRSKVRL